MVRGRGQRGEFPRLQLAWGDSNQMETVSNSEDIATAVWKWTERGMKEKRGKRLSERWIRLMSRKGDNEKEVGKGCVSRSGLEKPGSTLSWQKEFVAGEKKKKSLQNVFWNYPETKWRSFSICIKIQTDLLSKMLSKQGNFLGWRCSFRFLSA